VVAPGSERQRAIEIATLVSQQAPLAVAAILANARKAMFDGQNVAAAQLQKEQRPAADIGRCSGRHPQFHRETTGQILGTLKYGGATLKGGAIAGAATPQECPRIEDKIADASSAIGCLHESGRNVDFAFR
jgi:hypothetical protein